MKIGRNNPCPCGSGNKYKKCCLIHPKSSPITAPNHFSIKGKKAEEVIQLLAERTFLSDWCYNNPNLQKGKELCDLLVVFDDTAIIWQIKDLRLNKRGEYNKSEVEKNIRQLSGARRSLLSDENRIELVNPNRGHELFDPGSIKQVYLISAMVGEDLEYFPFIEEYKKLTIHVFNRKFTEIVLNELDTISDFIAYLQAKQTIVDTKKEVLIMGGEEELLAFYLLNNRSFERLQDATFISIEEGSWKLLQDKPEYSAKKQADRISYLWDGIISRAHESGTQTYERVARELARLNRFERRYFSKAIYGAHVKANEEVHDMYRRVIPGKGTSYCFLFMDDVEPRERRKSMLFAMCHVARGIYPENKKVLGIATEKKIEPTCSYDFCWYDKPDWSAKDQEVMEKLQNELGIFTHLDKQLLSEDEYPH